MTLTIILAAVVGFLVAILKNQWSTNKLTGKIGEEQDLVARQQGELVNTQKEADDAVKAYEDALNKLNNPWHGDDDNGGGNVH